MTDNTPNLCLNQRPFIFIRWIRIPEEDGGDSPRVGLPAIHRAPALTPPTAPVRTEKTLDSLPLTLSFSGEVLKGSARRRSLLFQPTSQQKRTHRWNQLSPLQLGLEPVEFPPSKGEGKNWQRRAHTKALGPVGVHLTAFTFYTDTTSTQVAHVTFRRTLRTARFHTEALSPWTILTTFC